MRLLLLVAVVVLAAGCRSTDPYTVPDVPAGAAALVLHDEELPRTIYASAWGAFAVAGWTVDEAEPDAFRFRVRPPDGGTPLDLAVSGEVEHGRTVAATAVATSEAHAVLEAAAAVLATIPGDLSVR